jgi:hypothetical protein
MPSDEKREMISSQAIIASQGFDRREFLKRAAGATGAAMVVGTLGANPELASSEEQPSQGGKKVELQRSTLSSITHYLSLRHEGPLQEVNATWARLTQFALSKGIAGPNLVAFAAACPCQLRPTDRSGDPAHEATEVRNAQGGKELTIFYDACLAISAVDHCAVSEKTSTLPEENLSGLRTGRVGIGDTHMVIHRGPYARLVDTYKAAMAAGATLGSKPGWQGLPVAFEVYRNNPLLTKPDALITEIHFPLVMTDVTSQPVHS